MNCVSKNDLTLNGDIRIIMQLSYFQQITRGKQKKEFSLSLSLSTIKIFTLIQVILLINDLFSINIRDFISILFGDLTESEEKWSLEEQKKGLWDEINIIVQEEDSISFHVDDSQNYFIFLVMPINWNNFQPRNGTGLWKIVFWLSVFHRTRVKNDSSVWMERNYQYFESKLLPITWFCFNMENFKNFIRKPSSQNKNVSFIMWKF